MNETRELSHCVFFLNVLERLLASGDLGARFLVMPIVGGCIGKDQSSVQLKGYVEGDSVKVSLPSPNGGNDPIDSVYLVRFDEVQPDGTLRGAQIITRIHDLVLRDPRPAAGLP